MLGWWFCLKGANDLHWDKQWVLAVFFIIYAANIWFIVFFMFIVHEVTKTTRWVTGLRRHVQTWILLWLVYFSFPPTIYRVTISDIFKTLSASHGNWCTATLLNRIITAQWEGMGDVGSARYEPALLPPCPTIKVLCYSNCQRSTYSHQQFKA